MKRIKAAPFFCFLICVCMIAGILFSIQAQGKTTQEKMSEAQKDVEEQEANIENAKKELESLQDSKAELEGSLSVLNNRLSEVSSELTALEAKLSAKQQEIAETQIKLEEAQSKEQEQYESMKLRIKYMYELGGNESFLQSLLEADDFADMLNRAEYYAQITDYDRQMLTEYEDVKNTIAEAKTVLEQDELQIQKMVAEQEEKQKEVEILVNETSKEIAQQVTDIEAAQQKALEYEKKLEEEMQTVEALKAQLAYEMAIKEAEKNQSGSSKPSGGGNFNISSSADGYTQAAGESQLDVMAAIIYCEAGAEPYYGKLAVGSVIMNRINSSRFPNTLLGVLYQKSQFTPVMSGRFAIVLANRIASDECYQAAQEVLNGTNVVPDCLFFRTVIPGIDGQIIGGHIFY